MRGRALGNIVNLIRGKNYYKAHREELIAIGFDYDNQVGNFELVKQALLAYKQIHGDLLVPSQYRIPADVAEYPEAARGMTAPHKDVLCCFIEGPLNVIHEIEESIFEIFYCCSRKERDEAYYRIYLLV